MSTATSAPEPKKRQTYQAGCHCGYIKFSVTVSPPLPETKPLNCDCSACRRFGYLLVCVLLLLSCHLGWHPPWSERTPGRTGVVQKRMARPATIYTSTLGRGPGRAQMTDTHLSPDMDREDVEWHGDSWVRLSRYQFNTKQKDQLFCGKCGASIGIDFRDFHAQTEHVRHQRKC